MGTNLAPAAWDNRIVEYAPAVPLDQLLAHPRNPKIHPRPQTDALKGILGDVGWLTGLIVNTTTGHVLDGHDRIKAAMEAGQQTAPVFYVAVPEAQEPYILATFDPVGTLAATDSAILTDLLREVSSEDSAVQALLTSLVTEPEAVLPGAGGDEFDATPGAGEPRVQPGDLWAIGPHRLLCGDSTDPDTVARLMGGQRAGAVVTDSPYGQNRDGIANDDPEGLRELFDGVLAALPADNAVVINFQSPRLFPEWLDAIRAHGHKFERALWFYDETDVTYPWRGWLMTSQMALVSSVGKPQWADSGPYHHDCYIVKTAGKQHDTGGHTTAKPLDVVQDLVAHTTGLVYDPFFGSGTTLIAAHRTGRVAYGLELSPAYCDVILRRAEAEGIGPIALVKP